MMLSHTGTLWHYLGSFVLYTLLAIGMIYAAYWYARRHSGGLLGLGAKSATNPASHLAIESSLTLDPRKSIHIVRAGHERFLIATTLEGTQLLSRLEPAPVPESPVVQSAVAPESELKATEVVLPFAGPEPGLVSKAPQMATAPFKSAATRMGARMVQSVQWLLAARGRSI